MTVLISNDGAVRTFTLHRPEALNALTPALLEELSAGLADAAADDTVRVVVLTGTGRAFSAGVDRLGHSRHQRRADHDGRIQPRRAEIGRAHV